MQYDLIVVGGGPAGMMASSTAARKGLKVLLVEKNEKLGKKLYITGHGRCNVTNYGDIQDFLESVTKNKKFLFSAFHKFTNYQLIDLLHNLGVRTKVERGKRVFPESDKASDITKGFEKYMQTNNVDIMLENEVKKICSSDKNITGIILKDNTSIAAEKLIIATGGMSYRHTGSTGDGYRMAKELGHSIVEPKPALVPLIAKEDWVKELKGLSLKNVNVRLLVGKRVEAEQFGELLFTHFGVSGPAVLTLSSLFNANWDGRVKLSIDLKPALTEEMLDQRLKRDFEKHPNKHLKKALEDLLPKRLIPVVIGLLQLEDKVINQITKIERGLLVTALKNLKMSIIDTRPLNEAIVTRGGINTNEINPSTMESKKLNGLYFAGEVIDVDALTGGYNLQIAFSTGYLSGISASEN